MNISKIEGPKDMAVASLFAVLGLAGPTGSIAVDFRDERYITLDLFYGFL